MDSRARTLHSTTTPMPASSPATWLAKLLSVSAGPSVAVATLSTSKATWSAVGSY